jgi:hypothetical protein
VTAYCVVSAGFTNTEPEVKPPVVKLVPTQLVAPVDDQESSDEPPFVIEVGFATSAAVIGAGVAAHVGLIGEPELFVQLYTSVFTRFELPVTEFHLQLLPYILGPFTPCKSTGLPTVHADPSGLADGHVASAE